MVGEPKTSPELLVLVLVAIGIVVFPRLFGVFDENNDCQLEITDDENIEYNATTNIDFRDKYAVLSSLFELSNAKRDQVNLLTMIAISDFSKFNAIVMEKANFYVNNEYSELATKLYAAFDCFFECKNVAGSVSTLVSCETRIRFTSSAGTIGAATSSRGTTSANEFDNEIKNVFDIYFNENVCDSGIVNASYASFCMFIFDLFAVLRLCVVQGHYPALGKNVVF